MNCGRGDVDDDQKRGSSTTRVEYDIIKIRNKTNNLPTEGEVVGHRDGGVDHSAHHLVKYVYLYVYLSPVVYKVDHSSFIETTTSSSVFDTTSVYLLTYPSSWPVPSTNVSHLYLILWDLPVSSSSSRKSIFVSSMKRTFVSSFLPPPQGSVLDTILPFPIDINHFNLTFLVRLFPFIFQFFYASHFSSFVFAIYTVFIGPSSCLYSMRRDQAYNRHPLSKLLP